MRKIFLILALVTSMGSGLIGCSAHINEGGASGHIL